FLSSLRRSTVKIDRRFTRRGQNPYEGITFVKRSSEIRNPDGSTVFKFENIDVPEAWSQLADDSLPILIALRNSGLPKIFLSQYVDGKLGPCLRNVDIFELKYGGSVGISNLRRTLHKRDPLVGILPATGKSSINFHGRPPERGKEL